MKKLLVLVLLGLVLGAGAWKAQNPEGTVADFRNQAVAVGERLKTGAMAVRDASPAMLGAEADAQASRQRALAEQLSQLETSLEQIREQVPEQVRAQVQELVLSQALTVTADAAQDNAAQDNAAQDKAAQDEAVQDKAAQDKAAQDELVAALKIRVDGLDASLQDVQAATRDLTTGQKATHEALDASVRELLASVRDSLASDEADMVRLDAIDSRLELLVRRLNEQTVEQDLISTSDRLESLSTAVSELRDDISTQAETVNNELASVTEEAAVLGMRIDTLSSAQAAMGPVASTVEDPSGAAEAADPAAADSADGGTASATGASNSQDAAAGVIVNDQVRAGDLPELTALTARLDQRFSALESRLATVNTDSRKIARIAEQLDDTQSRLTALQQESARDRKSMTELTATVSKLETAEESLSIDTVQDEIRDQLALVQSQFESDVSTRNTNALEKLLDNTRNQITALEQRVQRLPASSSEADTAQQIQSALESQIVALERRLESMTTVDPDIASTLSNVQEQVDELASRGFVTEADLRARNEQRNVQYKIYFDRNSAEITDAAAKVLNSFITQEKNRTTGVSIFGFTDRLGSAIYNQQLALQRATNVRSYLIQNGLDYTKIKALTGLGEDAAAAMLPDEADDAQQRVVVLYAAQP